MVVTIGRHGVVVDRCFLLVVQKSVSATPRYWFVVVAHDLSARVRADFWYYGLGLSVTRKVDML